MADSNYFYDPDNPIYSRELGRISPEGNVYGQKRTVRDVKHKLWWTGSAWISVEVAGQETSLAALQARVRPWGEVWEVPIAGVMKQYFRDLEEWKPLKWRYPMDAVAMLPIPGWEIGDAHVVNEPEVTFIWNGFMWERYPAHSGIRDDEPNRHLPAGLLQLLTPDARVTFVSRSEIVLSTVTGGSCRVYVNGEYVSAGSDTTVYSDLPSLEWNAQTNTLTPAYLEPDTEYWLYLANHQSDAFVIEGLPGDEDHNATRSERIVTASSAGNIDGWDFRSRLFLSRTPDTNGYLAAQVPGRHAKLVGKVQTDSIAAADGGPYFIREANISLVSQTANLSEAFRDLSDYRVEFVDQNNLILQKLNGLHGQIYVAEGLYYLGVNYLITTAGPLVQWVQDLDGRLQLAAGSLAADTQYYLYLPAKVDPFNFNEINADTNRPWQADDTGAGSNYNADLDLRLKPFVSVKAPDHGRLSEEWPGYFTRHIGQVRTDANGRFVNARDISEIRQPVINPTHFDGMAEAQIERVSDTEIRLVKKLATSGIINVAGEAILTYERLELEKVQRVRTTDVAQLYTEANLFAPLSGLEAVSTYEGQTVYLYLANSRPHWGELAGKTFFALTAPQRGYLSRNWPGNQARWIATIKISSTGTFGQNFLVDSVSPFVPVIDDKSNSPTTVLSASKVLSMVASLQAQINANAVYTSEQTQGLGLILERGDETHLCLRPISGGTVSVAFPNSTTLDIPEDGVCYELTGTTYQTIYQVYLNAGGMYVSTSEPTNTFEALEIKGEDSILVGWMTCGGSAEDDAVSLADLSTVVLEDRKGTIAHWVQDSGAGGHFTNVSNAAVTLGSGHTCPLVIPFTTVAFADGSIRIAGITGDGSGTGAVTLETAHASADVVAIVSQVLGSEGITLGSHLETAGSANPDWVNLVPILSSNTSASPIVVSATGPQGSLAFRVFDGTSQYWTAQAGDELVVDLGADATEACNKVSITYQGSIDGIQSASHVKIYGSDDNSAWTQLADIQVGSAQSILSATWTNGHVYRYLKYQNVSGYAWISAMVFAQARRRTPDDYNLFVTSDAGQVGTPFAWIESVSLDAAIGSACESYVAASCNGRETWSIFTGGAWVSIVRHEAAWQYFDGSSWHAATVNSMFGALRQAFGVSANRVAHASIAEASGHWNDEGMFDYTEPHIDLAFCQKATSYANVAIDGIAAQGRIGDRLGGWWNVVSYWNEPIREWSQTIPQLAPYGTAMCWESDNYYYSIFELVGFINDHDRVITDVARTGQEVTECWITASNKNAHMIDLATPLDAFGETYAYSWTEWWLGSSDDTADTEVINEFTVKHHFRSGGSAGRQYLKSQSGALIVTRTRNAS